MMRSTGTPASTDGQGPPDDNPYNELLLSISAFQADTSRLCLSVSVVAAPPAAATLLLLPLLLLPLLLLPLLLSLLFVLLLLLLLCTFQLFVGFCGCLLLLLQDLTKKVAVF